MGSQSQTKIKALSDAYMESLLADLPSEEEISNQQVLSRHFMRRMDNLIGKTRHKLHGWKKMLLVAAIISMILATAVSVYAYREVIATFFINVYEKYSEIIFPTTSETNGSSNETETGNSLKDKLPRYIPAGYHESTRLTLIDMIQITYTDSTGNILLFEIMEQGNQHIGINTEGVATEEVEINGNKGLYYTNLGQNNLIWADGSFVYTITSIITKEELIILANSTN